MATCLRDLLDAVDDEPNDAPDVDSLMRAARCLGMTGRVLSALCREGLDETQRGERESITRRLADHCVTASAAWPSAGSRRADLIGVVGDAVGQLRDELTRSDRWAVAIRLGPVARRDAELISAAGPYGHVGDLVAVGRVSALLRRRAAATPPDPQRIGGLDRPIPAASLPAGLSPSESALEAMAGLVDELHRRDRPQLTTRQMVAVCRASEEVARRAAEVSDLLPRAAEAWTAARSMIARFTDAAPGSVFDDALVRRAARTVEGLTRAFADGGYAERGMHADAVRLTALLPGVAAQLESELRSARPSLIVPVGERPLREARVTEWLARKAFMAERADVQPAIRLVRRASALSATLVTDLEQIAERAPERAAMTPMMTARRPAAPGLSAVDVPRPDLSPEGPSL